MYFVKKNQLQQLRNTNTLSGVGREGGQEVLSTRGKRGKGREGRREGGWE